ncbi:MAG TPA: hypothetical protein DHU96_07940 [Actinobacteria bacterium]|nr:hypothetical protein [Actinomycetota bacterium]
MITTARAVGQLGISALAGAVAGTALGNVWVLPLIKERSLFKVTAAVPAWITITVPAGMVALAGLAIAAAGALGPAIWAATSRTTTALHTE